MVKKRNSRVRDLRHVAAAVSSLRGIGSPEETVGSMCSVVRVVDAPATDSRTYIKHMCRATDRPGWAAVCNLGSRGGEGHCEGGVALMSELVVIVNTGVHSDGERWGGVGSNGPAVVLRLLGSRSPSEWSVGLGFHLNGPLASVSI